MSTTLNETQVDLVDDHIAARTDEIFKKQQQSIFEQTDRIFVYLMVLQYVGGIIVSLILSPRTWVGSTSSPHIHVWAAVVLGGAITLVPVYLALMSPGKTITRYSIAICQMLMSGLWIHLTGGRIETHFHIFGSLAFLSFYRDWKVLVPATVVVAADHLLRGIFWPESVYGVLTATVWRSLEHAGWVVFEDIFLLISIHKSVLGMKQVAQHRAKLETTNKLIEAKVEERTLELEKSNEDLELEVAERIQAETEAKDRQMRLQTIMETASDGIVTINSHGIVASFNNAASKMFGYPSEEVIGQNVSMLLPSPFREEHDTYLANYEKTGRGNVVGTKREVEGQRKDGSQFPIEMSVSEVKVNNVTLFTSILRDLTEEKALQCELAHAQKLESVGQLAAGIAHEINTPTQFVGDNTRFLKDAFDDIEPLLDDLVLLLQASKDGSIDETLIRKVETAIEEADLEYLSEEIPQAISQSLDGVATVAKIVGAMKAFSHPGSDEMSSINLEDAINTTITVAHSEWKYVAEMVTEFDPDLPDVCALPGELNQVILNLIVNAAHAIGDTLEEGSNKLGTITIGTRQVGDCGEIYIRDTGCGIPDDVKSKIFDPFFTTKEVGKGTGQGLAIAYSVIVDKHGGTINCESKPGEGTTFIIRLPIECKPKSYETV